MSNAIPFIFACMFFSSNITKNKLDLEVKYSSNMMNNSTMMAGTEVASQGSRETNQMELDDNIASNN